TWETPKSTSSLAINAVPHALQDAEGRLHKLRPAMVEEILEKAQIFTFCTLARDVRIAKRARETDLRTIYFDIWDSRSGATAKAIAGRKIFIAGRQYRIEHCPVRIVQPQCTRCWKWGHTIHRCAQQFSTCPICTERHE